MITDNYNRKFNYLRFSLTENCNLRCIYCMPEEDQPKTLAPQTLKIPDIKTVLSLMADLGVTKVRFTGGEPMLRPDFDRILRTARETKGIKEIHITTNGILLDKWLHVLEEINVDGINISLDTLNSEKFKQISKRNGLDKILGNIDLARNSKIKKLKINVVVIRDKNYDEIHDFIKFAQTNNVTVRFIELMPFDGGQIWNLDKVVTVMEMLNKIKTVTQLSQSVGTLTEKFNFSLPHGKGKIALIPSYSRTICNTCNRIRITHDGKLMNCLYSTREFDLGYMIRQNKSLIEMKSFIQSAMLQKEIDGFAAERKNSQIHAKMSSIGG